MGALAAVLCGLLIIGTQSQNYDSEWDLVLVQLVVSNGFAAPKDLYPTDPNHPKLWEDGLGQLTLLGKKQMYVLGKELRKRYSNLITANPHEVITQSSEQMKCMNSALTLLASLYAPTSSWEFVDGLKWQPVPVAYIPQRRDTLLSPQHICPTVVKEMNNIVNLYGVDTVMNLYKQQLKYWTINSGMSVKNWNQASNLYKILYVEKAANKMMPEWTRKYWKDLQHLNDFAYTVNFNNPSILKMVGGPILHQMARNAEGKAEDFLKDVKMILFSGQSEHVAGVLGAAGLFNNREPPFASSVVLELYRKPSYRQDQPSVQDYSVRMLFLNASSPHLQPLRPRTLSVPGCTEFCPLETFVNQTRHWKNKDWLRDCRGGVRE